MTNENDSTALLPPAPNSASVTEAFRVLAGADEIDVPKMPEQIFVEHILPMLSAPAGAQMDMTKWLDVAGTPLRAIDVVDNVTGQPLFRLPPLMRSLPTVYQAEVNFHSMIVDAQAHERNHPNMGERYLDRELSKVRTGATLMDVETAKQWNAIRARYNLPLLQIPGVDNGNLVSGSTGGLSLSDEQEDF